MPSTGEAARLDSLLKSALEKSVRNTHRYKPFEAALSKVLQVSAEELSTKAVASVTADLDNRLGEVVGRGKGATAISFLHTCSATQASTELQKATASLKEAAERGTFDGMSILWGLDEQLNEWQVQVVLSPPGLEAKASALIEAVGVGRWERLDLSGSPLETDSDVAGSGAEPALWLEFTFSDHKHGGPGWEFGTCLWSPTSDSSGGDRYAIMREPDEGDIVVHSLDSRIVGFSRVAEPVKKVEDEPPLAGRWADRGTYYRIELEGYKEAPSPIPVDDFLVAYGDVVRAELLDGETPKYYPFHLRGGESGQLRTGQGAYLTRLTPRLFQLIEAAVQAEDVPEYTEPPYTLQDALEGVFLTEEEFKRILTLWKTRRNIILDGPPGVGKTFLARRLAYALIGARRPHRVEMVQFHPSYSYEDFVIGWRPSDGGFDIARGVFVRFCQEKASGRPLDEAFVFIIDEINRGNLPKILGELMMLIEDDKRSDAFAVPLTYSQPGDKPFFVPANVFVLGLMNTADRSLALVDYALRRRFAFYSLTPAFGRESFRSYLAQNGVPEALVKRIEERLSALNEVIRADTKSLGPGFEIGHSYFCRRVRGDPDQWYRDIIEAEVAPLLKEYWFDDLDHAEKATAQLLE